ncbi:MAG: prepilin-type N-terminal cleavage/methylation domain-containing protein [Comamonas sp.]
MRGRPASGFTLVEVMVALFIMSLLALLGWRALDGMARVQSRVFGHSDQTLALQASLGQWNADLDALQETQIVNALDFDGRTLRITRHASAPDTAALVVVAWTIKPGADGPVLARWSSAPFTTVTQLRQAWQRAADWAQSSSLGAKATPQGQAAALLPASDLQLLYYRNNAWSNPLSSADSAAEAEADGTADEVTDSTDSTDPTLLALPDGVRLTLTLTGGANGHALAGTLVRDWVRMTVGARS